MALLYAVFIGYTMIFNAHEHPNLTLDHIAHWESFIFIPWIKSFYRFRNNPRVLVSACIWRKYQLDLTNNVFDYNEYRMIMKNYFF